jgi:hypothetical protein
LENNGRIAWTDIPLRVYDARADGIKFSSADSEEKIARYMGAIINTGVRDPASLRIDIFHPIDLDGAFARPCQPPDRA